MLAQNACLLTDEQVQTIHEGSLTILEGVGLLVHNPVAREVFEGHGCRVDTETQIVRFPPGVVEHWQYPLMPFKHSPFQDFAMSATLAPHPAAERDPRRSSTRHVGRRPGRMGGIPLRRWRPFWQSNEGEKDNPGVGQSGLARLQIG